MKIPVLIPAYNPDKTFVGVVTALIHAGFKHILIVNDGSGRKSAQVFEELGRIPQCRVLQHTVNLGKGRALKTGLNYFYLHFPNAPGVVTADADGQHTTEDILKVAKSLESHPNSLILGTRHHNRDTPLRSLIGNVITRFIFYLMAGKKISDTQTGLRGIPAGYVPLFIQLKGEGYDFEMSMLLATRSHNIRVREKRIGTVYIEGNRSSHFNPLLDSMSIYFLLFRFASSSLFASLVDLTVFAVNYIFISSNILLSIIVARMIASLINFTVNRHLVFHDKSRIPVIIFKYYLLMTALMTLTYLMIRILTSHTGLGVIPSKIMVEIVLFIVSFTIQRDFIFSTEPEEEKSVGKS